MNRGRNNRGRGRGKIVPTTSSSEENCPPPPNTNLLICDNSRRRQRGIVPEDQTSVEEDILSRHEYVYGVVVDTTTYLAYI